MNTKLEEKYHRDLYISPANFEKLVSFGYVEKFHIVLLVAFGENNSQPFVMSDTYKAKEFASLSEMSSIREILFCLNQHSLQLSEFILERTTIRLQSVVGGDLLIETLGTGATENHAISKVLNTWELPEMLFYNNTSNIIKKNKLWEIRNDASIELIGGFKNNTDLISFLLKEQQDEVFRNKNYKMKNRIYYTNPLPEK